MERITVNRVYVDAEGVVRMSTCWPNLENYGYRQGNIHYRVAIERAKEESIPFEDQDRAKIAMHRTTPYHMAKNCDVYTIEPIQVKLMGENHPDCGPDARGCSMPCHSVCEKMDEHRLVARIVTEEEKPAPPDYKDLLTSPKSWTEDYGHENGKYMCSCCYCKSQFMGHKRRVVCKECADGKPAPSWVKIGDTFYVEGHERSHTCVGYEGEDNIVAENNLPYKRSKCSLLPPAPVVDKPDEEEIWLEAQDIVKNRLATYSNDLVCDLARWAIEALKGRYQIHYKGQQPTEWIPVSERLPDQKLKYVDVWMDKNGGYRFANYHLDHSIYPEIDIDRIKEDFAINKITFWMPLPEPPKP